MIDQNGRREYWRSRIPSDLRSFGDAGELVDLGDAGSDLRARWTMLGEEREAMFSFSRTGSVSVLFDGRASSYGSFLAGPQVGDLDQVARRIARASRPARFVGTEAVLEGSDDPEPAVELLSRMIETPTETATRLVILTGGAGAGKTTILRELVARQADRYLRGETKRLLLYVSAQGRALGRFNEALALELRELRASLTGHSVATLAREGLVVPVIDGLDELMGVSGYDDAFASVSTFLDAMEGEGCVLAAARSTWYEEEFVSRASEMWHEEPARWHRVPVRAHGWAETQQAGFVEQWAAATALTDEEKDAASERLTRLFSGERAEFGRRPFFFTKAADLVSRRADFGEGSDLLRRLAEEYLERERLEKLLDRHIAPMLTRDRFRLLMQKLALEMWVLETRELDGSSLCKVVEDLAETEDLPEEYGRALVERLASLALLTRGEGYGGHRRIAFEHELFFFTSFPTPSFRCSHHPSRMCRRSSLGAPCRARWRSGWRRDCGTRGGRTVRPARSGCSTACAGPVRPSGGGGCRFGRMPDSWPWRCSARGPGSRTRGTMGRRWRISSSAAWCFPEAISAA